MNDLIIGVVPSLVSLISIIITSIITNSLVKYRVGELEKKQEKFNSLIERMYIVEGDVKNLKERIK